MPSGLHKVTINKGDLIGEVIFLEDAPGFKLRKAKFLCSCGNTFISDVADVRRKRIVSCGCYNLQRVRETITTHGATKDPKMFPTYSTYHTMLARCNDPLMKRYFGRGIIVCERWKENFENFLEDMGIKPFPKASIDRINNDGNYEPSNCRWADSKMQNRNKSSNRFIEYKGEIKVLSQWAEDFKVTSSAISSRLERGWTIEETFTIPFGKSSNISYKVEQLTLNDISVKIWENTKEAAIFYKIHVSGISEACSGKTKKCINFKWRYLPIES